MSWIDLIFFDAEPWPDEPEVATHLVRGGFLSPARESMSIGFERMQNPQLNVGDIVFMNGQPQGVVESIDMVNRTAAVRQMTRGEMHKRGL